MTTENAFQFSSNIAHLEDIVDDFDQVLKQKHDIDYTER